MLKKISNQANKISVITFTFFILFFSFTYAAPGPAPESVKLINPLNVHSIEELLASILNIIVIISTPIVVFFIIYSGFLYVTAKGDASKVKEATQSLTYSVIGGVLILGAAAIAQIIKNLVNSFI